MKDEIPKQLQQNEMYLHIQRQGTQSVENPRHKRKLEFVTSKNDSHIAEVHKALTALATICAGIKYVLTGGLSIPLTLATEDPERSPLLYRKHHAVHIGLPRRNIPKIVIAGAAHNYFLFSRIAMVNTWNHKKHDWYVPLSWEDVTRISRGENLKVAGYFCKSENLRLIKMDSSTMSSHHTLDDYFDVYAEDYNRHGRLVSNDDGMRTFSGYYRGKKYTNTEGNKIALVNLAYVAMRKQKRIEKRGDIIDAYDLGMIASYIRTHPETEWKEIPSILEN